MPSPTANQPRSAIRRQMRQRRAALSPQQQRLARQQLLQRLSGTAFFCRADSLAAYVANDGEINPAALLDTALSRGKRCYLPVLAPFNRLWFYRYRPGQRLACNRYGITEPRKSGRPRKPWSLNLVLVPLVAFDRRGNRLGMGGGYYDRTFKQRSLPGPRLLGLAHSCQELNALNEENWDIAMAGIATERELFIIKKGF